MKIITRLLLIIGSIGLAALTFTVEGARSDLRKDVARQRELHSRHLPEAEMNRMAQQKRIKYFEHLFFSQYPAKLAGRIQSFLCLLDSVASPQMECRSFKCQADAETFRFTLSGEWQNAGAGNPEERFRLFQEKVERLEGVSEGSQAETRRIPGQPGVMGFVLRGRVGIE